MNKTLFVVSLTLNLLMLSGLILIGSRIFAEKPPVIKEVQRWTEDKPVPGSITIAMLGNSLTAYADWNELLERNDVQNFGVADFSVKQLSWLLGNWVIPSKPGFCFINGGQEDIMLGVPLERIADDYSMIIDSLQNNGIRPIVQSTLMRWEDEEGNQQTERLNELLKSICNKRDIDFINLNTVLSGINGLKPQYTTDGMHLNSKGYELWSIMLKDFLLLNNPRKTTKP
jgi:lysophospholipase L1-like esterase